MKTAHAAAFCGILTEMVLGSSCSRAPATVQGAVLRQDADPRQQSPIANARITVEDGLASADGLSDATGYFHILLLPSLRPGQAVTLVFRHAGFEPLRLTGPADGSLWLARMNPIPSPARSASSAPEAVLSHVRIRYTVKVESTVNVGSGERTFRVVNTANVPCRRQRPCSPDGRWKAAIGSASLDAGEGNEFHNTRLSCIAGPCPFTAIDSDGFTRGGRRISVSILNWSDTTTFVIEGEVVRHVVNDAVRESYPVIFGSAMNFTLPAAAEGPSIEADLDGAPIVYPLGPDLLLSWARCRERDDRGHNRLYRCDANAGYRFRK